MVKKRKRDLQKMKISKSSKQRIFRKFSVYLTAVLCLTVVGVIIIDFYVSSYGRKFVRKPDELIGDFDCIIIPGASVIANKYPSGILKDRLDKAYEVYLDTGIKRILVSGDHGSIDYDEVNVMRDYLIDKGVPGDDIFMDHAGFDTYQTMFRAREIFDIKSAVIVTQDFHLYRALYIGQRIGIDVMGADSAVRVYAYAFRNRMREYPARVKAFIECEILKPDPKFSGEKIPIHGDNLTIDKK